MDHQHAKASGDNIPDRVGGAVGSLVYAESFRHFHYLHVSVFLTPAFRRYPTECVLDGGDPFAVVHMALPRINLARILGWNYTFHDVG